MMTLRLWRAFYQSLPRHPLFWQALNPKTKVQIKQTGWQWRLKQLGSMLLGLLIFIGILALGIPLLFFSYLLIFMGGLIAGGNAAAGISTAIAEEQEKGRYELIALSPPGTFGAGWALATRFLRTNRNALRLTRVIRAFHGICFVGVILIVGFNFFINRGNAISLLESGLVEMIVVLLLIGALHLDFVQAKLVGALIGLLASTYNSRRVDSAFIAIGLLLGIQVTIYLLIYSLLSLFGGLLAALNMETALPVALLSVILVFLTHEIALYWIWRTLQERLNLEPQVLQTLKRFGI